MKKSILNHVKAITAGLIMAPFIFGAAGISEAAELSIQQAIDMALAQNTDLAITSIGEKSARADLKPARGRNGISITASVKMKKNNKTSNKNNSRRR